MSKKSVVLLATLGVAAAAAGAYVVRRQVAAEMNDEVAATATAPGNQWSADDADALDERLAEAFNEELGDAADDQPAAAR